MKIQPHELDTMITRYFDGTLDADAARRLTAELETNGESRALLRGMAEQAFAVAEAGRCSEARKTTTLVALAEPNMGAKPARRLIPWPMWAAAALMLVGVGLWWQFRKTMLLEVIQADGAVAWTGLDGNTRMTLATGMKLPAGTLELATDTALALVRFDDGTLVSLNGRTEATFSQASGKHVRLRQGTFSAVVQRQPKSQPMRVFTPTAEVMVIGTEFSMDARSDETSLEVALGEVKMRRLVDGREASVTDHQRLVATLDPHADWSPQAQMLPATSWRMQFITRPNHVSGDWIAPGLNHADGALASQPFVAGTQQDGRIIVHHGVCVRDDSGMALVTANSELRMKIRTTQDTELQLIVGTRKPAGCFGGNFAINNLSCQHSGYEEWRELRVPFNQLQSITPEHSATPDGLITDFIILNSFENAAGLEVSELFIVPVP